jgi:hypothetical protein
MSKPTGAVPDAEDVFIAGMAFARAAEQIKEGFIGPLRAAGKTGFEWKPKEGTPYNMTLPWAVNNAFAIELLLKCLHIIEFGTQPFPRHLLRGSIHEAFRVPVRRPRVRGVPYRRRPCRSRHQYRKGSVDTMRSRHQSEGGDGRAIGAMKNIFVLGTLLLTL